MVFAKNGIPNYDGLYYNYHEWFLFSGLFDAGMFSVIFLGCFLTCLLIRILWAEKKETVISSDYQGVD